MLLPCVGVAEGGLIVGLRRFYVQPHLRQVGLCVVQGDLEFPRIQGEQDLSLGNCLAFMHRDVRDDARHVGGQGHAVRLDIGVIGADPAAAGQPPGAAADDDGRDPAGHQAPA